VYQVRRCKAHVGVEVCVGEMRDGGEIPKVKLYVN